MTSDIFVDSSVFLEAEKGNRPELLVALMKLVPQLLVVNSIVASEFSYHYLSIDTNVSPRTVKGRHGIRTVMQASNHHQIIYQCRWAEVSEAAAFMVPQLMADFNLLPNDALIIATCLSRNISALASFDPDFHDVCQANGLALLDSVKGLENWLG